jgi:hypothetical protein
MQPGQRGWADGDEKADADIREAEPAHAAHESQDEALGELIACDPAPASAERRADGELLLACLGPNQDEIGHVRAHEQHQQAQRAHEQAKRHPDVSDHIVLQWAGVGGDGPFLEQFADALAPSPIPPDASHVRVGLRHREARFQSTNAVVAELVRPVGVQALREEQVGQQVDEPKVARHHADDLVRHEIDDHGAAENVPVASEPSLPVPVAEDRGWRATGRIVFQREPPAQQGRDSERREHTVCHRHRRDLLGLAGSCDGGGVGRPHAELLEGLALVAAGGVHAGREGGVLEDLTADRHPVVDAHELVGVRIGQGLDQHAVHDAKHRGIRADAERQREHNRQHEPGMGADQACGLSRSAQDVLRERDSVHPVDLLADQRRVPQLPSRRGVCGFRIHPACDVLLGRDLYVELQLLLLFDVRGLSSQEARPVHPSRSVAGFMIRPMARTSCSQRDA